MSYELVDLKELKLLISEQYIDYKDKLFNSIKNYGVITPIVISNFIICDGYKRYIISKRLGIEKIPAISIKTDNPVELIFDLNDREFNINLVAILIKNLSDKEISIICDKVGFSNSPQMVFSLKYLSNLLDKKPDLYNFQIPANIWRELGHLGENIDKYAYDLITMPGTVGEKRNIASFLRQAQRRKELPDSIKAEKASDVIPLLQKSTQPRKTAAYEKYENALEEIDLPNSVTIKIDPTFSEPGININLPLSRSELDKLDKTKIAIEKLFQKVPEL